MASRRMRCACSQPLRLSSALLFLSAILLSSSFAQLSTPPDEVISLSDDSPSTPQTSASSLPSTTIAPSPTPTNPSPAGATSTAVDDNNGRSTNNMFNHYFVIVAIVVILFIVLMLYLSKRKKQKAAIMRSNSQRALAQDVEGLRNRFGMGRGAMRRAHQAGMGEVRPGGREERLEGLDERGEAPPPYRPGSKPPSLGSGDGFEGEGEERREQTVEMNTIPTTTPRQDPPVYGAGDETSPRSPSNGGNGESSWDDFDMRRPGPVVTVQPRRDMSTE